MTQLIFPIAFICAEKRKFTQTLNVDINSSTTENAQTQLSFLSAAKYKLANQKPYNPLRKPPPPHKFQGKPPLTQHNNAPLVYKTQLSKQITFTEA